MTAKIGHQTYYRTGEAMRQARISRATLLRWMKNGTVQEALHRDRRGWRLFTKEEVALLEKEARKMN
jgi:DNA-binding transcriptional MerR regulator